MGQEWLVLFVCIAVLPECARTVVQCRTQPFCNGVNCQDSRYSTICNQDGIEECHWKGTPDKIDDVVYNPSSCCKAASTTQLKAYYCALNPKSEWQKTHCCNSDSGTDSSDVWCCESEADCDYTYRDCYQFSHGIRLIYVSIIFLVVCTPCFLLLTPLGLFAIPLLIMLVITGIQLALIGAKYDVSLHASYDG